MYIPKHFLETDPAVLHAAMRRQPFATLVTPSAGGGFDINHIPTLLSPSDGPLGTLRGHVARANPLWQQLGAGETAAVFTPADHYVSPSWYPGKQQDPRVVPTWNYLVVHAWGTLRVIDDASWLHAHVTALTDSQEGGRADRWHVDDAPADFLDKLKGAIVGVEMTITRLEGKCKASQNRAATDRAGVIEGLAREGTDAAIAMAELVPR